MRLLRPARQVALTPVPRAAQLKRDLQREREEREAIEAAKETLDAYVVGLEKRARLAERRQAKAEAQVATATAKLKSRVEALEALLEAEKRRTRELMAANEALGAPRAAAKSRTCAIL